MNPQNHEKPPFLFKKGNLKMSKEIRILRCKNRIATLSGRNKDNSRIISKLQRELRNLEK